MVSGRNDSRMLRKDETLSYPGDRNITTEERCKYVCEKCGFQLDNQRWKRFICPSCSAMDSLKPVTNEAAHCQM
jgi:rubrerythrin